MTSTETSGTEGAIRVRRLRPKDLCSQRADTIVVIDVLRMTSTAAVLMKRPSCTNLVVAATLEEVHRLAQPISGYVLVSELVGPSWPGIWVDNSPARVSCLEFGERTPVLLTSNGTRALFCAAACASRVLLASFRDLRAVAQHLTSTSATSVVLLPAGDIARGEPCVEDDLCADALALMLAGQEPNLAADAALLRAHPRVRRRIESEPGFSADLDLALQGDTGAVAMQFQRLDTGFGHIRRAA